MQESSGDLVWRLIGDRYAQQMMEEPQRPATQEVPINIYETEEDVILVAPMPGVQAENIDIEVRGRSVRVHADLRGPGQEHRRYLVREWTYGPYERTVQLPIDVDAQHANASHSNGVLVVSLPKSSRSRTVRVPLRQVTSSEAVHQGHSGHHTTRQGLQGDE